MSHTHSTTHFTYTGPERLQRAVNTLQGLLDGISIDGDVNPQEVKRLVSWLEEHREFADHHPFNEFIPQLCEILASGKPHDQNQESLLWLCKKYTTDNSDISTLAADMQHLHGILGGIAADGRVTKEELTGLEKWMQKQSDLRGCWPFDELEQMITEVLEDGQVDPDERHSLMSFLTEFFQHTGHRTLSPPGGHDAMCLKGVCAVDPMLQFENKCFCFAGKSTRATSEELARLVVEMGASTSEKLTEEVDYLVIGAKGNPCWAFACYGRFVDSALRLRNKGVHILIVHEDDFWKAVRKHSPIVT